MKISSNQWFRESVICMQDILNLFSCLFLGSLCRSWSWRLSVKKPIRRSRKTPSWLFEFRSWRPSCGTKSRWDVRIHVCLQARRPVFRDDLLSDTGGFTVKVLRITQFPVIVSPSKNSQFSADTLLKWRIYFSINFSLGFLFSPGSAPLPQEVITPLWSGGSVVGSFGFLYGSMFFIFAHPAELRPSHCPLLFLPSQFPLSDFLRCLFCFKLLSNLFCSGADEVCCESGPTGGNINPSTDFVSGQSSREFWHKCH